MVPFDEISLTSQNDRMSVSEEVTDEVYLRNSASMPNDRGDDFFSNAECSILNRVGRDLAPATGAGWTGASGTAVAAVNDVRLRYWCICKTHRLNIVYSEWLCAYALQNDFLGLRDIVLIPFAFDPGEAYGGIEDCKVKRRSERCN